MTKENGYRIEVASPFAEFWRYNVALMCGCFDVKDNRTDFVSAEDTVADVGANLQTPPENYPARRRIVLETPPCDHIVLYIYLIPHTLPAGNDIADTKTFPLQVRIVFPDGSEKKEACKINQWSGASIELRIPDRASGPGTSE